MRRPGRAVAFPPRPAPGPYGGAARRRGRRPCLGGPGAGSCRYPGAGRRPGTTTARSSTSTTTPGGPAGSTPGTGGRPGRGVGAGTRLRSAAAAVVREIRPIGGARGAGGVGRGASSTPGCREGSRQGGSGPSAGEEPRRGSVGAAPSRASLPAPFPTPPGTFRHSRPGGKGGIGAPGGHFVPR